MHFCERCQVNPVEVVAFGTMCLCEPCAFEVSQQAYGGHVTGALEDVSPFGVLLPPIGLAEGFGIIPPTAGVSAKRLASEWNKQQSAMPPVRAQLDASLPLPRAPLGGDPDRDGFPFLKVIFVLGAVGAVALVGSALVRATRTARHVREGAADVVKKHPELLAAL